MVSSYTVIDIHKRLQKYSSENIQEYDISFLRKIFEIIDLEKDVNVKVDKLNKLADELVNDEDPKKIILICDILIEGTKNFSQVSNYYLWRWHYLRGKRYCTLNRCAESMSDIEKSIGYIENEEGAEVKYTHSLWVLAYTYSKMGNKMEAMDIYKKLSKCYKDLNYTMYRIACIYNIATILNNENKKKTLRAMLSENTFPEEKSCISHKNDILNKMDKKE